MLPRAPSFVAWGVYFSLTCVGVYVCHGVGGAVFLFTISDPSAGSLSSVGCARVGGSSERSRVCAERRRGVPHSSSGTLLKLAGPLRFTTLVDRDVRRCVQSADMSGLQRALE